MISLLTGGLLFKKSVGILPSSYLPIRRTIIACLDFSKGHLKSSTFASLPCCKWWPPLAYLGHLDFSTIYHMHVYLTAVPKLFDLGRNICT